MIRPLCLFRSPIASSWFTGPWTRKPVLLWVENAQETHRREGGRGRLKKFRGRRLVTRLFAESFRIMSNSRDGDFFFFFFFFCKRGTARLKWICWVPVSKFRSGLIRAYSFCCSNGDTIRRCRRKASASGAVRNVLFLALYGVSRRLVPLPSSVERVELTDGRSISVSSRLSLRELPPEQCVHVPRRLC